MVGVFAAYEKRSKEGACDGDPAAPGIRESLTRPAPAFRFGRGDLSSTRGEGLAGGPAQRDHAAQRRRFERGVAGDEGRRQARGARRALVYHGERPRGQYPLYGGG